MKQEKILHSSKKTINKGKFNKLHKAALAAAKDKTKILTVSNGQIDLTRFTPDYIQAWLKQQSDRDLLAIADSLVLRPLNVTKLGTEHPMNRVTNKIITPKLGLPYLFTLPNKFLVLDDQGYVKGISYENSSPADLQELSFIVERELIKHLESSLPDKSLLKIDPVEDEDLISQYEQLHASWNGLVKAPLKNQRDYFNFLVSLLNLNSRMFQINDRFGLTDKDFDDAFAELFQKTPQQVLSMQKDPQVAQARYTEDPTTIFASQFLEFLLDEDVRLCLNIVTQGQQRLIPKPIKDFCNLVISNPEASSRIIEISSNTVQHQIPILKRIVSKNPFRFPYTTNS